MASPCHISSKTQQERKEVMRRVLVGRRQEQVAQVAHGVVLDVVHVAQRPQRVGRQRVVPEVIEVDALQVQAARPGLVGVDGGSHTAYYSEPRPCPDGRIRDI